MYVAGGGGSACLSVSPPHAGKNSYVTTATILYAFNPTPYPNSASTPFLIVTLEQREHRRWTRQ